MDCTSITDCFGIMHINPKPTQIKSLILSLQDPQTDVCPHPDVSISHYNTGHLLTYHKNKILTLENLEPTNKTMKILKNISQKDAIQLFSALNNDQFDPIINRPWIESDL
tara:strand:+ start:1337 stop:1666 length:330 start_codon:yes stop_codon:yes gene_type:complete